MDYLISDLSHDYDTYCVNISVELQDYPSLATNRLVDQTTYGEQLPDQTAIERDVDTDD